MGRAARTFISWHCKGQRSVLDGAIRDNYPVRIRLEQFERRELKWYFKVTTKDDSVFA